jgi:hypothetical protein
MAEGVIRMSIAVEALITNIRLAWPSGFYSNVLTDAVVLGYINKVQRRVCRAHDFSWMESQVTMDAVDGQRKYSLPTAGDATWTDSNSGTVRRHKSPITLEVIDKSSRRTPMDRLLKPRVELMNLYKDTTGTGKPAHWCVRNEKIEVYPLPSDAANGGTAWSLDFEYYGYLADLVALGSNYLTNNHQELLEAGAIALGYEYSEDFEKVALWEGKTAAFLTELGAEDDENVYATLNQGVIPAAGQSLGCTGGQSGPAQELQAHYE